MTPLALWVSIYLYIEQLDVSIDRSLVSYWLHHNDMLFFVSDVQEERVGMATCTMQGTGRTPRR